MVVDIWNLPVEAAATLVSLLELVRGWTRSGSGDGMGVTLVCMTYSVALATSIEGSA